MIDILLTLFYFLLALGILVAFHEFGHYWVAVKSGVKVERFAIGFGKPLFKVVRGETEYVIGAIPLGGYVKMLGDQAGKELENNNDKHRSFDAQSVWKRTAIVAAGPVANFILAFIFFWVLALSGKTFIAPVIAEPELNSVASAAGLQSYDEIVAVDGVAIDSWSNLHRQLINRIGDSGVIELQIRPFQSQTAPRAVELPIEKWMSDKQEPQPFQELGLSLYLPEMPAIIHDVVEKGAAYQAGFNKGDKILSVNNQHITNWLQWSDLVKASPGQQLLVEVAQSSGATAELLLIPDRKITEDGDVIGIAGVIGRSPGIDESMLKKIRYNVFSALGIGLSDTVNTIHFTLVSIKKLIWGQISVKTLGGPVSIAKYAGETAAIGWQSFVSLLAVLSVSLGVLNLLPIPALDGGRLVFYACEILRGKPLALKTQEYATRVGILIIMCLMLFALFNDFSKL